MSAYLPFPQSLCEKYRPSRFDEFIGLEKHRRIMARLAAQPYASAWLFIGASGTGKTTLALAFAEQLKAELHHIGSQQCNLETLETVVRQCHYVPLTGGYHVILCDEADAMSDAAQKYLLSKLDSTEPLPQTIWIFTANQADRLEPRFQSRCKVLEFSTYGINGELKTLLQKIWKAETEAPEPNFDRISREAKNNVREALQRLELELLAQ